MAIFPYNVIYKKNEKFELSRTKGFDRLKNRVIFKLATDSGAELVLDVRI